MPRRRSAETILQRSIEIAEEYENDPERISYTDPNYSYYMKHVRIGSHERLGERSLWYRLPDSFEALYQLSGVHGAEFERLMDLKQPDGWRVVIHKGTEAALVTALCHGKAPATGPEVRLCYELKSDDLVSMKEYQRLIYIAYNASRSRGNDGRENNPDESKYGLISMQGAFYLVRPDENDVPTLYVLRERQADTVLKRLAAMDTKFPFKFLGTSAVKNTKRTNKDYEDEIARPWDNIFFAKRHPEFDGVKTDEKYKDVPLKHGKGKFKKLNQPFAEGSSFTSYKRSPREVFDGGDFFDVTGQPLPDKITRYVQWRGYIPKEVEKSKPSELVAEFAKQFREDAKRKEQLREQEQQIKKLEETMRAQLVNRAVQNYAAEFAANMPEDLKAAIEAEVAKKKKEFLEKHGKNISKVDMMLNGA